MSSPVVGVSPLQNFGNGGAGGAGSRGGNGGVGAVIGADGVGGKGGDGTTKATIKRDGQVIELEGFANEYSIILHDNPGDRKAKIILENDITGERITVKLRAAKRDSFLEGILQFEDREVELNFDRNADAVLLNDAPLQEDIELDLAPQPTAERLVAFSGGGWNSHSTLAGQIGGALEQSGQDLSKLFANTQAISANSGGTWFLSHLAYSDPFRASLENQSERDRYNQSGYNGQVRQAFSDLTPDTTIAIAKVLAEAIGVSTDALLKTNDWQTLLYEIGLAGNALSVNKLNWRNFVDQFVYGYSGLSNLQWVNLDSPRLPWAAGKDLSFSTAITAYPTVIQNQGGLSQNKLFAAAKPDTLPSWWNQAERKPAVLPLLIVSDANGSNSQSGYAELPFGAVDLQFSSNQLWPTRLDPITGKINQTPLPQLSIVDATTASSSAAGLLASPDVYGTSWLSEPLRNTAASLLREMATLASFAGNGLRTPREPAALSAKTKLADVAQESLVRLADGAYVDNTSVAYGLRQLQRSSGLAAPFEITLLMNSCTDPITMLPMPIGGGQQSSFTVQPDVAKLFGFSAEGKPVKNGVLDFDGLPLMKPSVPSPWIFDVTAWQGIDKPIWSFSADGGSYSANYVKLPVTTLDNEILGIRGGQQGVLHLFLTNNSQSKVAPVTPSILDEYDQNYLFGRQAMATGGWEQLATALGVGTV